MGEKIRLNLVMTYQVSWKANTIMNNFIQNFYDALGMDKFAAGFHYEMENTTMTMTADVGFALDWLLYLGTSTKRKENACTAGGFGEGFKIASLTAYRDYNMAICMESRDWKIRVTEENGYIDGKSVKFLAYDVENREYQENSRLILENVNEDFYKAFSEEIRKFYYVENPYFGKCIAKKEKYAVYEAENIDFPGKYKGAVFSGYQLRAYIEPPLIICNHKVTQREDDRDRTYFYNSEIGDCIKPVILSLSPEEALNVLEKLEPFWAVNKKMEYEWRWPIRHLICRISEDKEISEHFTRKYRDRLVTLPETDISLYTKDILQLSRCWYQAWEQRKKRKVVISEFHKLDIDDIVELCRKNNGFATERDATESEQKYIKILEKAAGTILNDLLCMEKLPVCKVLLNPKAPVNGYTKVVKKSGEKNCYKLRKIQHADYVFVQSHILQKDSFGRALAVYSHELLHQYGGDQSMQFRKALLLMNKKFMENTKLLDIFEKEWRQVV